jgi:hypothetical protein
MGFAMVESNQTQVCHGQEQQMYEGKKIGSLEQELLRLTGSIAES